VAQQHPFALLAGGQLLEPGEGAGQLERALDILARVDFSPDALRPDPPVSREECILVSVDGEAGYGASLVVGREARLAYGEEAA